MGCVKFTSTRNGKTRILKADDNVHSVYSVLAKKDNERVPRLFVFSNKQCADKYLRAKGLSKVALDYNGPVQKTDEKGTLRIKC